MSGIVFISYRRSDTATYAGRLYDRLEARLTSERLFMDVDSIGVGEDFVRIMRQKVTEADVVLAVIGQNWTDATSKDGKRRLDDPEDPVRIELETALGAEKRIIPVLCGDAEMPSKDRLPNSLRPLSTIHALRVENERFRTDMAELERVLDGALADVEARRQRLAAEQADRARLAEAARQAVEEERRRRTEEERQREAEETERNKRHSAGGAPIEGLDERLSKAEELALWDFVKSRGRISELREHLQRWPNGITRQMALATLEQLEWTALGQSADEAALRDFVERFPDGEHKAEAEKRLAALAEGDRVAREAEQERLKQAKRERAEAEQARLRREERERTETAEQAEREARALAEAKSRDEERRQARERAEAVAKAERDSRVQAETRARERKQALTAEAKAGTDAKPAGKEIARVEQLSKSFGRAQALSDVSLVLREGEILGLFGEDGAGKSTLLGILEGTLSPDSGNVWAGGMLLDHGDPNEARAAGIRVVHQEPAIVPELTVAENIFLGATPRVFGMQVDRQRIEEETDALLTRFGMERELQPDDPRTRLRPAQRLMIEIMRAARGGPHVVAFDEPTSLLEDAEKERLFRAIRELGANGAAIILASGRPTEILGLVDRLAVLCDGRCVVDGPAKAMTADDISDLMADEQSTSRLERQSATQRRLVLKVSGLSCDLLRGVDLTISSGEILGIFGPSGPGSSLARAIAGLDRRLAGSVAVDGQSVPPDDIAASIAAGIGFVPADRRAEGLLLSRSILDNAALGQTRKMSSSALFNLGDAIAFFGPIWEKLSGGSAGLLQPVAGLSGADQQKVMLTRVLARGARVLVLDEPTRGVDVAGRRDIQRVIADLASSGIGVLLISSDTNELARLSDRIMVIAEGRLSEELPPGADLRSVSPLDPSNSSPSEVRQ